MAWQDRPYYRDGGSSSTNPLMWLLTGSVPFFTIFGIRVRIHASMLVFIGVELLLSKTSAGLGPANTLTAMTILFASVLLHEFGHCFGARWVGGEANDVLLWPLGGLAMTSPPHRWGASFVTTAMGPAVNLGICIITGTVIAILNRSASAIPWFPLVHGLRSYVPHDNATYYIWWVFLINYALFTFNMMLVFYPFDAGRMVQELLWWRVGYYKSMLFATTVGKVGAVVVAAVALMFMNLTLLLIAVFGFITCHRQRQMLRESGPEEWQDSTDYSAAYEQPGHSKPKRRKVNRRAIKRARKLAMEAQIEQQRVDTILAKVSAQGMHSLTWSERRALRKATERQKKRDIEMARL